MGGDTPHSLERALGNLALRDAPGAAAASGQDRGAATPEKSMAAHGLGPSASGALAGMEDVLEVLREVRRRPAAL